MFDPAHSGDNMAERLQALNVLPSARLAEAADIRGRFTKARDANVWPDLGSQSRPLAHNDRPTT
jgi:hypothetical protein